MNIDLSIIIVNYNGKHFLKECIDSIVQYIDITYEIVIVDNASSDDSVQYIKNNFPELKLIESGENAGFGKGNNIGAKYASGTFLLLLNNDTRLLSPISSLIDYMNMHDDVGIIGCRLLNSDGSIQYSVGYYHTPFRLVTGWMLPKAFKQLSCCQLYEKRDTFYEKSHPQVEWVSGAFMLVKRDVWDALGGMDEAFFMYLEDVDFCQRAWQQGWKTAYRHDIAILHHEGGTGKWRSRKAFLYTMDSCRIYIEKHYGVLRWIIVKFLLVIIMSLRGAAHYMLSTLCADKKEQRLKGDIYFASVIRLLSQFFVKKYSCKQ